MKKTHNTGLSIRKDTRIASFLLIYILKYFTLSVDISSGSRAATCLQIWQASIRLQTSQIQLAMETSHWGATRTTV